MRLGQVQMTVLSHQASCNASLTTTYSYILSDTDWFRLNDADNNTVYFYFAAVIMNILTVINLLSGCAYHRSKHPRITPSLLVFSIAPPVWVIYNSELILLWLSRPSIAIRQTFHFLLISSHYQRFIWVGQHHFILRLFAKQRRVQLIPKTMKTYYTMT